MVVHDAEIVNVLHLPLVCAGLFFFGGQLKKNRCKRNALRIYTTLPFG